MHGSAECCWQPGAPPDAVEGVGCLVSWQGPWGCRFFGLRVPSASARASHQPGERGLQVRAVS